MIVTEYSILIMNVFSLRNSCMSEKPEKVLIPGDNEKFPDRNEYLSRKRFNPAAVIYMFFLLSVLLLFPYSCDNIQDSPIPYVPVSLFINLNIVNELTVSGNSVMFPNYGFGGIVVYCEYPGSYYAYDAGCTKDLRRDCRVINDGALAECPCCGSVFVLMNSGYPSKGPAEMPLKQYHVTLVNNYELRVYN